jgi:YD repeat-containing protein
MRGFLGAFILIIMGTLPLAKAEAAETVVYSYDAQGRLIGAAYSGSSESAGQNITLMYDASGNRTAYTVSGSRNLGQQVIVLPLNGFTIIPIGQ